MISIRSISIIFRSASLRALMQDAGFDEVDSGTKIVHRSERDEYPAIFGLGRKSSLPSDRTYAFRRDEELVGAVRRYVAASREHMRRIDAALRVALADCEAVIVWGAGQLSYEGLIGYGPCDKTRHRDHRDSSPQRCGMHLNAIEIVPPAKLQELPPLPIVVTSIHSDDAIAATIERQPALHNKVIRLYRDAPGSRCSDRLGTAIASHRAGKIDPIQ